MKLLFTQIFVGLGALFLVLILISMFFFIIDPYELKPLLFGTTEVDLTLEKESDTVNLSEVETGLTSEDSENTPGTPSGGFTLSENQKLALVSYGIDPASVPASISMEQESCFTGILGASRVLEIKGGAVPNAFEFLKAKSCM